MPLVAPVSTIVEADSGMDVPQIVDIYPYYMK